MNYDKFNKKTEDRLTQEALKGSKWAQHTLNALGRGDKINGQDDGEWREPLKNNK